MIRRLYRDIIKNQALQKNQFLKKKMPAPASISHPGTAFEITPGLAAGIHHHRMGMSRWRGAESKKSVRIF
jgi:hypothetical protein